MAWLNPKFRFKIYRAEGGARTVNGLSRTNVYISAHDVSPAISGDFTACYLPTSVVLFKKILIPDLDERDLEAAANVEVEANSPFSAEDTVFGWRSDWSDSSDEMLLLTIVIASRSQVEKCLVEAGAPRHCEVWADCAGPVVFRGFGETARLRRESLLRKVRIFGVVFSTLSILALPMAEVLALREKVFSARDYVAEVESKAGRAIQIRDIINSSQMQLDVLSNLKREPSVLEVLEAVSVHTPDTSYYEQINIEGNRFRGNGVSSDAAGLLELYSRINEFYELRSPTPVSRLPSKNADLFSVEFRYLPKAEVQ